MDSAYDDGLNWRERVSPAQVMQPAEELWGEAGGEVEAGEVEAAEDLGMVVTGSDSEGGSGVVSSGKEGRRKLLRLGRWALPWVLGGVGGVVARGGGGSGAMLVHADPVVWKEKEQEEKSELRKGEFRKGEKFHGHITAVNRPEPQQVEVLRGGFSQGEKAHGHTHTRTGVNRPEQHFLAGPITVSAGEPITELNSPRHGHAHPPQHGGPHHQFSQLSPNLGPAIPLFPSSHHGHSHPPNPEDQTTRAPPSVLHDEGARTTYHIPAIAAHDLQRKPEADKEAAWTSLIKQDELLTHPPSPLSAGVDPEKWPKSRLEPVSVLDKGNPLPGLRVWGEMKKEEEERGKEHTRKNVAPLMLVAGEEQRTPMVAVEDGKGSEYQGKVETGASTPATETPNLDGKTNPLSSSTDFLFRPSTPNSSSPPRTPIPWPDISPDHPTPPLVDPAHQRTWPNSPSLAETDYENFPQSLFDPLSVVDEEDPLPSLRKWWEQKETEREWREVNRETGREGGGSSSHKSGKNTPVSPQPDPVFEESAGEDSWGSRSSWDSTENSNNNNGNNDAREGSQFRMSTPGSEASSSSSSPMYPHPKSPGWQIFGGLTPGLKKNQQKEIIMMHKLGVPAKDKWGFVKWNLDSTEHGARLKSGILEWGGELLGSLFGRGGRG